MVACVESKRIELRRVGAREVATALDLAGNRISDVSPLANLSGLNNLNLLNNRVMNLSDLSGLEKLV